MNDDFDLILPFREQVREGVQRARAGDELGVARCPLCNMPIAMRVDCQGPRFVCACAESQVDRDAA